MPSVDRIKAEESKSESFTIRFDTPLTFNPNEVIKEIAIDVASLTYSLHNVSSKYNNDKVKYSHDVGNNWNEVTFPSGAYDFIDLNDFLHTFLSEKGHVQSFGIGINFYYTNFICSVEFLDGYQLDLRGTKFSELIGFDEVLAEKTAYGKKTPNITNGVDSLHINLSIIGDSIVSGSSTNTLYVIPVNNYGRAAPFMVEPKRAKYNRIN